MKKFIFIVLLTIMIFRPVNVSAYNKLNSSEFVLYGESTIWKYRTYNGKIQKRLWDTYNGTWLTPWINV